MAVRFLLDENLSEQLVRALAPRFAESLHVRLLGLGGAADLQLWNLAVAEGCVFVTKDEDFVKLSVLRGPPPKVIWLNTGNVANSVVSSLMLQNADAIEAFVADPDLGVLALGFGPR